jgi:hypothetical protein
MSAPSRVRTTALIAAVVTGAAVVYTLALVLGLPDPVWAPVLRAVLHLGELAALVGLALCGAAGRGAAARWGFGLAATGQVLLAVAEVLIGSAPDLGGALFGAGPLLVGLGLVLVGIGVLRTGVWRGWRRGVPLALGTYVFVLMTPVLVASGGPPAVPALWALAGWDVLWFLVGWDVLWFLVAAAVLVEPGRAGSRARAPQTAA